jgi:hypothetical protein
MLQVAALARFALVLVAVTVAFVPAELAERLRLTAARTPFLAHAETSLNSRFPYLVPDGET